ncbi:general secretion pathway protein GspN [Xanthomonas sp. 60]
MALERLDLRSGLLLGLVGAAGALWLAALLGFGGRPGVPDTEAATPPPLPVLPAMADDPMRDLGSASVINERPVFSEDRRPHPFRLGGGAASTTRTVKLTGVVLAGEFGMATLTSDENRSLRLRLNGDVVDGWQLLALEPRRATVLGPEGAQVLELAVFDGQGGEPPTQLRPVDLQGRVQGRAAPPSQPPQTTERAAPAAEAAPPRPVPAEAPAGTPATTGPSQEQMEAIRERIRARRQQLQQQQQQRQPAPPTGGGAANN